MAAKLAFVLILTLATSLKLSSAATYIVGDSLGWTIPPTPSTYSTWSSSKNFLIGDILVFNFTNLQHNVAKVTKTAFDSCNGNSPIAIETNPPARFTLNTSGEHRFICAVPGHCSAGQKLSVTVRSSSPAPASDSAPAQAPAASSSAPAPAASSAAPAPAASSPAAAEPSENAPAPKMAAPPAPSSGAAAAALSFLFAVLGVVLGLIY